MTPRVGVVMVNVVMVVAVVVVTDVVRWEWPPRGIGTGPCTRWWDARGCHGILVGGVRHIRGHAPIREVC